MRAALFFASVVMLAVAQSAFAEPPKHLSPLHTAMSILLRLQEEQIKRLKQVNYQSKGIGLLKHPEIREMLKISEEQANQVRLAFEKMEKDIAAEAKAAKLSPEETQKKYFHLGFGVPEKVQGPLS